jgi:predicted RNA-binding protein YlxR (DUF448 family)
MKVFKRKVGTTFKRMVLIDETLFRQMRVAATPALTPAQALRKRLEQQALASLKARKIDTKDKLAIYHTIKARLGQLGAPEPAGTVAPVGHHEPVDQNVSLGHETDDEVTDDGQEGLLDEDDAPDFEDAPETFQSKAVLPTAVLPTAVASDASHSLLTKQESKPEMKVFGLPDTDIPSQFTSKYLALKKLLDQSRQFQTDQLGRVVIGGKTIPDSNFQKIMRSFYVRSNEGEYENAGRREVLKKMAELKMSESMISVASAKAIMQRGTPASTPTQSGKGYRSASIHHPPGHRPKLLYMYKV